MAFRNKRKSSSSRVLLIFLFLLIAAAGVGGFILFFEGEKPTIDLNATKPYLGQQGVIHYVVSDNKSGIRDIKVWGSQGEVKKELHSATYPRTTYSGSIGPNEETKNLPFNPKKAGFVDGTMTITVEVKDFSLRGWFKGNKTVSSKQVTVDTIPPRVQILHSEKYISPGGTGIGIYRLSDAQSHHGIEINGKLNPGFLIGDGRDNTYISYFALPYDLKSIENLQIVATDQAGNKAVVPFSTVLKKSPQKRDSINVSDGFLNRKIPEFQQYYPEMKGDFIDKYLYANRNVRVSNNAQISALCDFSSAERMWDGAFYRMAGSGRAGFADHRTYFYKQKPVDKQVHLGMDIASTRRAEVRAANKGKVVFADYLGIYGNMVLLDHGQGVFSLYSHLSQINVAVGDVLEKKSTLGLTGTTGMAGGDHLHFSMLINGVFVTPKEWWDRHWIEVTIEEPITDSKF